MDLSNSELAHNEGEERGWREGGRGGVIRRRTHGDHQLSFFRRVFSSNIPSLESWVTLDLYGRPGRETSRDICTSRC